MPIKIYTGNLLRKRFVYSIIVALFLSVAALTVHAEKNDPSIDNIAIINGSVITREEFNREIDQVKQKILQRGQEISPTQLEDIGNKILENLIDLELLFQESHNNGIKVEKEKIDSQIKALKQKLPNNAEFEKLLTELKLSESALKLKIKKGIAIQELVETRISQKIKISDKETKVFYDTNPDFFKQPEQVKASHILIKVAPDADELTKSEAKQKLRQIQQKLNKGEEFATLAKEFSEGPSKTNGGDLGYFQRGQMVKPFEDAAFALKPEKVSNIVETQFGYHLIKVVDKKPEKTIPYEDVKDNLVQHLKQEKTKQKVKLYIQTLREKAKIEKFL
ncbi:MAG: peptidylprolyl isomerase [Deltaproteobacteria bacterium]|nr:peptidylprolyl isomerase [Deltaproteobacteria bacterium]